MSLQVIKAGLLDTIQDQGRYGNQHLGINPGGAMDRFSSQLVNALLGKDLNSAVIEMHFPAAKVLFKKETVICISGGNFSPTINRKKIPVGQPVIVNKNTELQFIEKVSGARCYLSMLNDIDIERWLNSYSTNLIAQAGGMKGRSLKKGDVLGFKNNFEVKYLQDMKDLAVLPWKSTQSISLKKEIRFIKGNEWNWLADGAMNALIKDGFLITSTSDRMGYRLKGNTLKVKDNRQLISSAVTFGTMQLLPDGQLILLMADHQTTGGYPRIAHVISADLALLAQCNTGDEIKFTEVEVDLAQEEYLRRQRELLHIQTASKFKMENVSYT